MELEVTRSIWVASAKTTWEEVQLLLDLTTVLIIKEFADEILAETRYVRHASHVWIKDKSMGMRIGLSLGDGGVIVVRMIHSSKLLCSGNHNLTPFRIVLAFNSSDEVTGLRRERNGNNGRVPVVDCEEIFLIAIDGEVACGCSSCIYMSQFVKFSIESYFICNDLTVFFNIFSACVQYIQPWMEAAKRWVDNFICTPGNIEEHHVSISGIKSVHMKAVLCFRSSRSMR
mmetsp:Transcript_7157/g.10464  ORF Transcript_7157/g.10464 Transcript_7157/m.10464 type:complete len:229 (-) Transcript_7157:211-897(-)